MIRIWIQPAIHQHHGAISSLNPTYSKEELGCIDDWSNPGGRQMAQNVGKGITTFRSNRNTTSQKKVCTVQKRRFLDASFSPSGCPVLYRILDMPPQLGCNAALTFDLRGDLILKLDRRAREIRRWLSRLSLRIIFLPWFIFRIGEFSPCSPLTLPLSIDDVLATFHARICKNRLEYHQISSFGLTRSSPEDKQTWGQVMASKVHQ